MSREESKGDWFWSRFILAGPKLSLSHKKALPAVEAAGKAEFEAKMLGKIRECKLLHSCQLIFEPDISGVNL